MRKRQLVTQEARVTDQPHSLQQELVVSGVFVFYFIFLLLLLFGCTVRLTGS